MYGYSVITGLGAGIVVQAPYTVTQAKHGLDAVASVTAFISCGQMAGVALLIGISTSTLLNQAADGFGCLLPGVLRQDVQDSIAGVSGADFFHYRISASARDLLKMCLYHPGIWGGLSNWLISSGKRQKD